MSPWRRLDMTPDDCNDYELLSHQNLNPPVQSSWVRVFPHLCSSLSSLARKILAATDSLTREISELEPSLFYRNIFKLKSSPRNNLTQMEFLMKVSTPPMENTDVRRTYGDIKGSA